MQQSFLVGHLYNRGHLKWVALLILNKPGNLMKMLSSMWDSHIIKIVEKHFHKIKYNYIFTF